MQRSIVRNLVLNIAMFSLALIVSGCQPRGETKTLKQVVDDARLQYRSADQDALDPDITTTLTSVTGNLEKLVASVSTEQAPAAGEIGKQGEQVADALLSIVRRCGFTVRPAMGELISQYRMLGSSGSVNAGAVQLLVGRTYTLLSSELETTRFRL